ncbi:hypothetical protein P5673_013572 [Acropora cervicornis]|uniref:Uncharacterized protein n=1 Tax=Acropora cervicornis TaxID=6130 RepID=A0AAD9QKZ5_ACRCE|nr:hypothetical protein P5673_013572 [Acropora cervicornis]
MSSNELQASLDSLSDKSKKKEKSKKEKKKDKKEKKKKSESKDLDENDANNVGEDEEHEDEPSKSKRFGLFRIGGKKAKGSKDSSKDSLKSEGKGSGDLEANGSQLSLDDSSSTEESKSVEVLNVNKNGEKTNLAGDAAISSEQGAESAFLKTEPSQDEISRTVQSETSSVTSRANSKHNNTTIAEDQKGNEKGAENASMSGAVTPGNELALDAEDTNGVNEKARKENLGAAAVGSTENPSSGDVDETAPNETGKATAQGNHQGNEDDKQQVQEEMKLQEGPQNESLAALTKDENSDGIPQVQVNDELPKLEDSKEENGRPLAKSEADFEEKEKDKRTFKTYNERQVILDQSTTKLPLSSEKETSFTSHTPDSDIISTTPHLQRDLKIHSVDRPGTKTTSEADFELNYQILRGIKEVKKFSPVLLMRLKKIKKKLEALRGQLLYLKENGGDEVDEMEGEELPIAVEDPRDETKF